MRRKTAGLTIAIRYTAFAAIATAINLAVQACVLAIVGGSFRLWVALALGTVSGIVPKYWLDKRWIFGDTSSGLSTHTRKLTVYTLLSVVTTFIFWGTEILFDWLGNGGPLHYLGGAIGLAIGYWCKYHLDRRITFRMPA
jgi:putative flippase GtrA